MSCSSITIAYLLAVSVACALATAGATDLQRPAKIIQTPLGNLLVAEVGTAASAPNTGRVSIVDRNGNQRTLFVSIGEGNPTIAGPVPRTEVPNPAVSSPLFSSVLAVHFSASVEKSTTGVSLTLADHDALKQGAKLTLKDAKKGRISIELITDFPDYVAEPLPALATNVRHSHPYGVVADEEVLYVVDGGYNVVHAVDIDSGLSTTLASFPNVTNPLFGIIGPPMSESVPTSICWDGDVLLVTIFNGFPFAADQSRVQVVDPDTGDNFALITGLTSAIDVVPLRKDCLTVGYLTLEYSVGQLAGLPGRLQAFDMAGASVEVLDDLLITPASMTYDPKSGTVTVAELTTGNLVVIPLF